MNKKDDYILEGIAILSIILNVVLVGVVVYLLYIGRKKVAVNSEEEIRMMVDASAETSSIDESEVKMINNIFDFDNKTAGDIAVHRTDITALAVDSGLEKIIDIITTEKYSRIPVYEENIDNIVGILYVKDILKHIGNLKDFRGIVLKDIIRKAYFVPISKKTNDLFEEMQKNQIHMSVVVDEYGGTYGIVTMEDLIEEILGNILDEYDEEELPEIKEIDENTFEISGTTSLEVVEDCLEVKLPVDEYETMSGFIIGQLGHIPADHDKPEIEFNGLLFKVTNIEEKRIQTVIVCRIA